ncbi:MULTISPECIES: FAD-binding dehydrogenase [Mycobacterium]|uniref:FAD-binding dehydrogenase n=1 Tax=Mycobacterium pseudoshottsii TaxID=265949 RepID=A0A9N7LZ57_9MYCO|nr:MULTISPECIES: FAD-binding dehydrogenase [Mycobacterium]EPQ45738.1 FAD-binding dehydrogenase [Mycobacterium sp. 012931]MBC9864534.1 Fumarate/succinate/L-aspartate dehydrogenase [Mycobacterium pseudoshottsii]BBA90094.1 FAD-binding dehydrogenase [Mycobacterium pseudoshottsii JCM 15466]BDN84524.1 FAD-binding dehydrogenase [Mycobacterium pseudoshottsii]BEH78912.1 FAD-binding dehydrogenase [Mycobacterium pseudoshottsii]
MDADVIVVGAGLAGLVATHELTRRGKKVAVVDQENEKNLGGQAFWSFGGLFLVDSPEQRHLGIKDSLELAWNDWSGSAAFDRPEDEDFWATKWARAYVEFAAGEKRSYLTDLGIRFMPTVGWAERGDLRAEGHGNSVPRFHIAWGTGTGVVEPFVDSALQSAKAKLVTFYHRHRVDELVITDGVATGIKGTVLAPDDAERATPSNRDEVGKFELSAQAVIITTGGIGGNHDMVRRYWPDRMGTPPASMIAGVPAYVDGRMLDIANDSGVRLVNRDRMWHYTEGVNNWDPIWPKHAIRIIPGPSSMWFDALGRRLPVPYLPGYDTLGTLRHLRTTPEIAKYDHSWFILNQKIIKKEFALSGSEQNPDITGKSRKAVLQERFLNKDATGPVEAFKRHGADFVVANSLEELVEKMNGLTDEPLLDPAAIRRQIEARDLQVANPFCKDVQVQGIRNARRALGDRLGRVAAPHRILDPKAGPLIATKLHILTRKTLGGIQTDLSSRAIGGNGEPIAGLYAAGEVAGFGGGGVHGYNALEGTFLGGCIFSGRAAGRAAADAV